MSQTRALRYTCEQDSWGTARWWVRYGDRYVGSIGNGTKSVRSQERARVYAAFIVSALNEGSHALDAIEAQEAAV